MTNTIVTFTGLFGAMGSLIMATAALVVALFRRGKHEGVLSEVLSNTSKILDDHETRIRILEALGRKSP